MNSSEQFRLALFFYESSGNSQEKYMFEYIKNQLYISEKPIDILDICKGVEKDFKIVFSELEVKKLLDKYSNKNGISISEKKYSMDNEVKEKIQEKIKKSKSLEEYVTEYTNLAGKKHSQKLIKETIDKFIYYCFDKNKQDIIEILGNGDKGHLQSKIKDLDIPNEEREIVNDFLNWDNLDKDKYLFDIVQSSFNFGMLTVKKGINSDVLKGKKFFLDANVIIALSGIGNKLRVHSIYNFEKKCRELGIKLLYTSTTSNEINSLLINKVRELGYFIEKVGNISPDSLSKLETGGLEDFYVEYYDWKKTNDPKDLTSFHKYIRTRIQKTLLSLSIDSFMELEFKYDKRFSEYYEGLAKIKESKRGYYSKDNVEIDVINYLHLDKINSNSPNRGNLYNVNNFIISLDRSYISWAETIKNNFISVVTHPLMWLTFLLQYTSRTSDDYSAFTKFLQLPINEHKKIDIKDVMKHINEISSDDKIKERLIIELSLIAQNNQSFEELDLRQATKTAYDNLMSEEKIKMKEHYESEIDIFKKEFSAQKKIDQMNLIKNEVMDITQRKMKKWNFLKKNGKSISGSSGVLLSILILLIILRAFDLTSFYGFISKSFPNIEPFITFIVLSVLTLISTLIIYFIGIWLTKLFNLSKIEKRIYDDAFKKLLNKYKKIL